MWSRLFGIIRQRGSLHDVDCRSAREGTSGPTLPDACSPGVVNAYGVATVVPDPEESVDPESCSIVKEAVNLANILEPSVETVGVSRRGLAGDILYEESAFSNLLVIGSHGQGGKRLVSGDTRDQCVHHVLCPITVVP